MAGKSPKNLRSENERLTSEVEELRLRLDEAEQALDAIRTGQAESLIVEGPDGPRIFSLEGADHSYRVLVEAMNEGAATFGEDGTVLYCNARFAEMLDASLERVMGGAIGRFIVEHSRSAFDALVREAHGGESRGELELRSQSGKLVPAYVSVSVINDDTHRRCCLVATDLRAQKRNEEILAAERLARSVLEQAAEAIVVCDEEGRVIRASRMAAELAGRNPMLARFDAVFPVKVDPPPEGKSGDDVATFALQGGVLRVAPGVLELSDGSKADVLVTAAPLTGDMDRVIGCVITMANITERTKAEETLRSSEERYRALFEHMAEGFFLAEVICDERGTPTDYRYLDANAAFDGLTGLARANVIGRTAREVLPGVEETWIEAYGKVALSGEPIRIEQFAAPLGRHYSTLAYSPRRGQFACLFQDVTSRKLAENHLRESEQRTAAAHQRIQSVIDNTPAIVYAFDLEERFVMANSTIAALLNSTPEQMIGRRRHEFMPQEDADKHELNDRQVIEAGTALTFEEYSELGGGRCITWLTTKFPLRDAQGRISAVAGISTDITERKRADENLLAANRKLAEADRRKDEFLAVLSHELRNPLAPIANSLYILDRASAGGEQATRAKQVIDRQVAHLSSLVNDLLDVTRITRNKIQLQKERLGLNDVVRGAVEDSRSWFERAEVGLEFAPAPRAVHVIADRHRVAQVIGNLLQNAAKFTLKGGCTRVTVAEEESAAVVRVSDDGVGMACETLAGLFEPFMQADHTLDRSKGGLGLGLALAKGIIELHGGSVSAHSEGLGRGTEFVVRLPLDRRVAAEPVDTRSVGATTRRRILIIEDNVDAADSLREALELSDHEVATAHDGPEGLAKARVFQPEVVLCDIGLPGMDGFEVARAFRADERLKGAFLVALSGYALPEDLQRASEAGFERHLAKPPSPAALAAILGSAQGQAVLKVRDVHDEARPEEGLSGRRGPAVLRAGPDRAGELGVAGEDESGVQPLRPRR